MIEFIAHAFLILNLIIKLSCVVALMLWIVMLIRALKIDKSKKKEVERLRELNDSIELLIGIPFKKAREFMKLGSQKQKGTLEK